MVINGHGHLTSWVPLGVEQKPWELTFLQPKNTQFGFFRPGCRRGDSRDPSRAGCPWRLPNCTSPAKDLAFGKTISLPGNLRNASRIPLPTPKEKRSLTLPEGQEAPQEPNEAWRLHRNKRTFCTKAEYYSASILLTITSFIPEMKTRAVSVCQGTNTDWIRWFFSLLEWFFHGFEEKQASKNLRLRGLQGSVVCCRSTQWFLLSLKTSGQTSEPQLKYRYSSRELHTRMGTPPLPWAAWSNVWPLFQYRNFSYYPN